MDQASEHAGLQRRVDVNLGDRAYAIDIQPGSLQQAGRVLVDTIDGGAALIIADRQVAELHGDKLHASLIEAGVRCAITTFEPGEPHKNIATCEQLWQACADHKIDRAGTIIALGGGVSGDTAGFVAATWMRGIRFIQIPTTLLAMVDSAVGGKTGVNSTAGKNLIGAFKQPDRVLIDPDVLTTMGDREYRAGLAEIAKYGVINDADFFAWQETNGSALAARDPAAIVHAVARSCEIKAWYVVNDEQEHGVRAHLNYGHTFGHAIERETKYEKYLHGEAVAIGMTMAAACANKIGLLASDDLISRQQALLEAYRLPTHHQTADDGEIDRLVAACTLDKKARKGQTRFVLPRDFAHIDVVADIPTTDIAAGFSAGITS